MDDNSDTGTRYPSGLGTGMIFYPRVAPVPEPRRVWDVYFFHLRVTQRVPDTLLPLWF
jgi:hypothetical protein